MKQGKKIQCFHLICLFWSVSGKLSKKEKSNYKFNEKYIFGKNIILLTELLIVPIGPSLSLWPYLYHAQSGNVISIGLKLFAVSWVSCAI